MQGRIIKGIAGFYYVESGSSIYECRAKGIFRNRSEKPLPGDYVEISILDKDKLKGNVDKILPRKNATSRPEAANLDQALVVFALKDPDPDLHILDRILVSMEHESVPSLICFNKSDMADPDELKNIYTRSGYKVFVTSTRYNKGIEELKAALKGRTTAIAGPSGAGKSSLINLIAGRNVMETGEISEKIRRGKNTTRHSELVDAGNDIFILDTPGFTAMDLPDMDEKDLDCLFPEFIPYIPECRFRGCSHRSEPGCEIRKQVEEGNIMKSRYENYLMFFEEIKDRRKW